MNHPLQCRCGKLKGYVTNPRASMRVTCYCEDCQAFAHFLGRDDLLDERGASDIVQLAPRNITITQGADTLACMRLTGKGLYRWYASCCRTPVGNMMSTPTFSFVGLVTDCLAKRDTPFDEVFGPPRAVVHPNGAHGTPKPAGVGFGRMLFFVLRTALKARLNGDYKRNPFFHPDTGAPIAAPRVLNSAERWRVGFRSRSPQSPGG